MKPTEAEFYERLNRMDEKDDGYNWVKMLGDFAFAFFGWVMGLLLGYFIWGI